MSHKILIVIPARARSKGIKNKNLKKIKKISLIEKAIKISKSLKYKNKFITISTDSLIIQKIAKKNNCWCETLRPKKYSGDKIGTNKSILHVISSINKNFDYIVQLQPTYFFRSKKIVEKCIDKIIYKKINSVVTVNRILDTSHPDYCLYKKKKKYFSKKNPLNFARQFLSKKYQVNGVCLVCKYEHFLKKKNMLSKDLDIVEIKNNKIFFDINNKLDLKIAGLI